MAKSIGIDLGTTNSVGAIKKVHTEVLKNYEGDYITPSCVTLKKKKFPFSKQSFVVGKDALEWIKQDPKNTVVAVKRFMGRKLDDTEVQKIIEDQKLQYRISHHSKGTENSLAIILNGADYTPEEISAKILKKVRQDAEKVLGDDVEYAVITVPAYFNDKQKHATRTAAALAGLKVRRLLPEPTAAAISFGVDSVKGDDAKTVLIFDFGGGTFDLSVLMISGGQFIEQGKGGDMWLGGTDIDHLMEDYVLKETAGEYRIDNMLEFIDNQDEKRKNRFMGELKAGVEKAKILLSTEKEACIEILGVLKDRDGDGVDVEVELTRDQFDEIIAPTVETTINLTKKILESIHFTPDLIDNVLLVGGCSQIPSVINALKQEFGDEKVMVHDRPMLAIAEGAAILSHRLSDTYECPQCGIEVSQSDVICKGCDFNLEDHTIEHGVLDIVHSAAHDYYIYLENDERHLFVEKNTPLPCEKTEVFRLVHTEQKLVHMKFYNIVNDEEESIGDLWLGIDINDDIEEEDQKDALNVEITLSIDENNIIEVTAALKELPDVQLSKTLSRGKADEKLFLSMEEMLDEANQKGHSRYIMVDLLHRCLSSIKDINRVINPETDEVDNATYDRAALKIEKSWKMAADDKSPRATIYYAEQVLDSFAPAIPPDLRKVIRKKVDRLEKMEETGTYVENLKAYDDLADVLKNKLGVVKALMEIEKAGSVCMRHNPSKAPKFFKYIRDILDAFERDDSDKAIALLDEIMPEAYELMGDYDSEKGIIYKDITR